MRFPFLATCARALLAASLLGCLGGYSPTERVQEAAQNLNMATRLGRMDIALEGVSGEAREAFAKRRASWGNRLQIVDYEFQGLVMRDKENADVFLAISWHHIDESEMRLTSLVQRWKDHRGSWMLVSEERSGGDEGLLGETLPEARPVRRDVQFESITIR